MSSRVWLPLVLLLAACRPTPGGRAPDAGPMPAGPCFDLARCQAGCDRGAAAACLRAAEFHLHGWTVPADRERERRLAQRACDLGDGFGCEALVNELLVEPAALAGLMTRAAALHELACQAGVGAACDELVQLMLTRRIPADAARATELVERACRAGDMHGCDQAWASERTDARREALVAVSRRACDAGQPGGCTRLVFYAAALGVTDVVPLRARAIALLARACELGYPPACADAADLLDDDSPLRDLDEARRWYARGCRLGDAAACARER